MTTVRELIAYLENLDGDMPVFLGDSSWGPMALGIQSCEVNDHYWFEGNRVEGNRLVLGWDD